MENQKSVENVQLDLENTSEQDGLSNDETERLAGDRIKVEAQINDIERKLNNKMSSAGESPEKYNLNKEKFNTSTEEQCLWLLNQNKFLHLELLKERQLSVKFQKKLKYIQDNHEVFDKLKEAYVTLKYNESTERALVKVKEESCQAIEISEITPTDIQIDSTTIGTTPGYIQVRRQDLDSVKRTVQTLKELIVTKSIPTFGLTDAREAEYKKDIAILFTENCNLKQQVLDMQQEINAMKKELTTAKKYTKEHIVMKKIIAKMESALRIQQPDYDKVYNLNYTDKEKKIVTLIMSKYDIKLKKKTSDFQESSEIDSNSYQNIPIPSTSFFTPRTPTEMNNKLFEKDSNLDVSATFSTSENVNKNMKSSNNDEQITRTDDNINMEEKNYDLESPHTFRSCVEEKNYDLESPHTFRSCVDEM